MRKCRSFVMCLALVCWSVQGRAGTTGSEKAGGPAISTPKSGPLAAKTLVGEPPQLFSPSVAQKFYELAYDLADSENAGQAETEQAMVFCSAAMKLDSGAAYIRPLLIKLASRYPAQGGRFALVYDLLKEYVSESADLEVVEKAVSYLVGLLNSREEREKFLQDALQTLGNKNVVLGSELATVLGQLSAEKPDREAAGFYLAQAYKQNRYNRVAFRRLGELFPDKIAPDLYIEHLRLALREDPSDIGVAVSFSQYLERMELYDLAMEAYAYCADLFGYLYPDDPLPASIYLPWAMSCYNTARNQHKCLQIANSVRESGRFDLLLEALAGRAASKMGDGEQATRIFQSAEARAEQLLRQGPIEGKPPATSDANDVPQVGAKQFAWFYCFALPNPQKALDWANKAYSMDPNSASTAGILAYALLVNNQPEWAKPLLKSRARSQIGDLVQAEIQLKEGQKDSAIEMLKSVVAKDPGSLEAERARDILSQQGAEYMPLVDRSVLLNVLEELFGKAIVPKFTTPDRMISAQFNIRGNKFPYGSEFGGVAAIVNNSSEPLVISDNGLFKGGIRIDADVSGDLTKSIPNLVSARSRTCYLVASGQSVLIPVQLFTGELKQMLATHPQASLEIAFTLYIDPVVAGDGAAANRLTKIAPTRVVVKRPGIELTSKYLRNRFNQISTGQQGQKINTAQLFVGLLKEQYAMSNQSPPYRFMYADWMPTMFRNGLLHESGLLRNPSNGEWVVKTHTMAEMLSLPLDRDLLTAVAENLNNSNWPVRLTAVYLLAKPQAKEFDKVRDWAARYDPSRFVCDMAVALGAPRAAERPPAEGLMPEAAEKAADEPAKQKQ